MTHISDEQFEELVREAVAVIPERYATHLNNVAFMTDDVPSQDQLRAGNALHGHTTLLGLYQGVPLPRRAGMYSGVTPDVITIFKQPHEHMAGSLEALRDQVHQTVWHEVAHYFGLDHGQIHELEVGK